MSWLDAIFSLSFLAVVLLLCLLILFAFGPFYPWTKKQAKKKHFCATKGFEWFKDLSDNDGFISVDQVNGFSSHESEVPVPIVVPKVCNQAYFGGPYGLAEYLASINFLRPVREPAICQHIGANGEVKYSIQVDEKLVGYYINKNYNDRDIPTDDSFFEKLFWRN